MVVSKKVRSLRLRSVGEWIANKVVVYHRPLADRLHQKGFGERHDDSLVLDLFEALFLLKQDKFRVVLGAKSVSFAQLLRAAQKSSPKFYKRLLVYFDVRQKGFVIRTGFKFGFDFRVYPRGKKPGEAHTEFVIDVKTQDERLSMAHLSRMVRLAQTLHTTCLQAVVDSENEINYYSMSRTIL